MKLIYTKSYHEYYSLWVKIRANTNLVIEGGHPTDSEDHMTAEFSNVSLCGMVSAVECYVGKYLCQRPSEVQEIVDALKGKLSDYPTKEEISRLYSLPRS